jgi:hypothetical protein
MRLRTLVQRLAATCFALFLGLGTSSSASAQAVLDECGTIITQPFGGCTGLFMSDSGLVYQDNTGSAFGGHAVGDVVHVSGTYDVLCATFCTITGGCFSQLTVTACIPPSAGTPYCFGDGSATTCPCGNAGAGGEGCANSGGSGATLVSTGSASVVLDDMGMDASKLLPGEPALLFSADNMIAGGNGILFGDGLRCAGTNVVRLGTRSPDASGNASWSGGMAGQGGWVAGDTRYFQTWYRDPLLGPCASGFNLSHGVGVTFAP